MYDPSNDSPNQDPPGGQQQQPTTTPGGGFGHPVYDQIGNFMRQYWGTEPTHQDVSGWGTNVDSRYMSTIQNAIATHPNAAAYQARLKAQQTPPPGGGGGAASSSPVTATGQIPPPGQAPVPPPVQTAAPAPTGQAPTTGPGALTDPRYIYQAPTAQTNPMMGAQQQAVMNLLQNPHSMTDQGVQQLKEQQKEAMLQMQHQSLQQLGQSAAQRGTFGGGTQLGLEQNAQQNTIGQLMNAYRGIDLQRMGQDRQDELNAIGATTPVLGAQQGFQQNAAQLALQQALGQQGLATDYARLGEQGRQFDLGHQLEWQRMLDQGWMNRGNLGLGYANMDQASQIALMNLIFGGGY